MSFSSIEIHRHSVSNPWTYQKLDERQRAIRDEVLVGGKGMVLFSEVAPVITLGRGRVGEDLLLRHEEYSRMGVEIYETSRGGRATYHGTGQWVVFLVDSLERVTGDRRGVRKLVDGLFSVALEICRAKFPRAEIREDCEAGVWSEPGVGGAKLAALGVRIDRGVVQHGFSLNIFQTPTSFMGINPCGLAAPVGYLESADLSDAERERSFLAWRERIEEALLRRFYP